MPARGRKRAGREPTATRKATSVSTARMAVQSTIDLVAQLSENLPQYMNIDSTLREHDEKVKKDVVSTRLRGGASASSSYAQSPERKKRKYERKVKKETPVTVENKSKPVNTQRDSLVLCLPRDTKEEEKLSSPPQLDVETLTSDESSQEAPSAKKKTNWMRILPSRALLERRAAEKEAKKTKRLDDPTRVYVLRVGQEDFVALPYLYDPSVPDFIKYKYSHPKKYYVEDDNPYAKFFK